MRSKVSPSKDRAVFRRTAMQTKRVNIKPMIYRGGIRL
jgi:hypothetical protein